MRATVDCLPLSLAVRVRRLAVIDPPVQLSAPPTHLDVLLIGRDARLAGKLEQMLLGSEGGGFRWRQSETLAGGIEQLLHCGADVVLLDVVREEADARDAFDAVRVVAPHTPVVVLSDRRCRLIGEGLVRDGAHDHLLREELSAALLLRSVRYAAERQRLCERIEHDASHDRLTGLPNRASFVGRLKRSIARARQDAEYAFAVLFLDLDHFNKINDSLGHESGDQLLVEVSRRLKLCVRGEDVVSRFGGDEFVILLEDVADLGRAVQIAQRMIEQLKLPILINEQPVFTTPSIGISWSGLDYEHPSCMLRDADTAMYRAKANGRSCIAVFDQSMRDRAVRRLHLEKDLRSAIHAENFLLHYQPIVELRTGRIAGFEALIRWNDPDRGLIPPAQFIPTAEETGLIIPIGRWMLRSACRQLRKWNERFPSRPLTMNVNLSSRELMQADLLPSIDQVLAETGVDPGGLKLEITETALIDNDERAAAMFRELKQRGIRLGIDDFGMGYSSLSYLHRFAFDMLKIDRSFVNRLTQEQEPSDAFVGTIVALARNLNMQVVAEGIETGAQLAELQRLECDFGQGYLFSRPIAAELATELLQCGGFETRTACAAGTAPPRAVDDLILLGQEA